jgi:purine nucleoside phosphorylase
LVSGRKHYNENLERDGSGGILRTLSEEESFLNTLVVPYVLGSLGVKKVIITDAAGGLTSNTNISDVVLMTYFSRELCYHDFLKYGGTLDGHSKSVGVRVFEDAKDKYSQDEARKAWHIANAMGIVNPTPINNGLVAHLGGTFVIVPGPSFESIAEGGKIAAGLDVPNAGYAQENVDESVSGTAALYESGLHHVVGMAGPNEVFHLRLQGMDVLHMAVVTDYVMPHPEQGEVTHEKNQDAGTKAAFIMMPLAHNVIGRWKSDNSPIIKPSNFLAPNIFQFAK